MSDTPRTIKPATPPPPWTHTPGPWSIYKAVVRGADGYVVADLSDSPREPEEGAANARRIVACVNALEGVDDPAAFVAAVRRLLDAVDVAGRDKSARIGESPYMDDVYAAGRVIRARLGG